ncbi:two pore segment channel 3 isoform X2 [Syngnathus typhle]|uniref:two pore segment channel 3 isoform X2 n=1 Tax=Syngnathus typhle TaxID=161592 RepID=UPI002A6A8431|nr:two pore segment channel 3 isoform X2 [Syngnathus typhle]
MTSTSRPDARACAEQDAKSQEDLELASAYVSDAQYNRNVFFDTSPPAVRLYLLYNRRLAQVLLYFFILLDLSLALWEEPAVVPLPPWATMLAELLCLHVFALRLVHYAKVIPRDKFWKDPKNICMIAILALMLVDMIVYGALHAAGCYALRWSRVLRPLLLVNVTEGRQLRRAIRSIRNALPQILTVFLLFIFSILIFSLMALKLFSKRGLKTSEGAAYFSNYADAVFDLYVLVTTANSPDVMMPAYDASSAFALFFIVYILVNTFIFMSVFLAVVFNNYKKYLKEEVRLLVRAKRHKMARAFAVLQEHPEDGGAGEPRVSRASWSRLVRSVQPDMGRAHTELLWSVSDDRNRGAVDKRAFVQLADLLNIQVMTLKSRPHPLGRLCPAFYRSAPSRLLCRLVRHRFDTIIVVCALVATVIDSALQSSGGYTSRQILDIVFILRVLRLIRVVDSIKRFRTIMNTLIRIGPAILTFGQLILVVYYVFAVVGMELFKGKVKFEEDDAAAGPAAADCGNPLLRGSAFARLGYCKNNFNNVLNAFVLLVQLTVVNQWHVLSSGFSAVTHKSARIYFVLFHITVVIIIINIFVAFVLEAFFLEYTLDKSNLHSELEKKIEELQLGVAQEVLEDNLVNAMETSEQEQPADPSESVEPKLMFKIASKRYRTVDALLQRLFEADLEQEDGDDAHDANGNFANPSFGSA